MLNIFTIKINFIFRNLKFELAATIDNNGVDEEIIKNSKLCKVTRQNDCKLRKTRGWNQDCVFYTFVQGRPITVICQLLTKLCKKSKDV